VLTNACQLRDFGSLALNRMVVRFAGEEGADCCRSSRRPIATFSSTIASSADPTRPIIFSTRVGHLRGWFTGKGKPRAFGRNLTSSLPASDPRPWPKGKH